MGPFVGLCRVVICARRISRYLSLFERPYRRRRRRRRHAEKREMGADEITSLLVRIKQVQIRNTEIEYRRRAGREGQSGTDKTIRTRNEN